MKFKKGNYIWDRANTPLTLLKVVGLPSHRGPLERYQVMHIRSSYRTTTTYQVGLLESTYSLAPRLVKLFYVKEYR